MTLICLRSLYKKTYLRLQRRCFEIVKEVFAVRPLCRYATIYTMFPVFSLVLDQDVKPEMALLYPELYKDLTKVPSKAPISICNKSGRALCEKKTKTQRMFFPLSSSGTLAIVQNLPHLGSDQRVSR